MCDFLNVKLNFPDQHHQKVSAVVHNFGRGKSLVNREKILVHVISSADGTQLKIRTIFLNCLESEVHKFNLN